PPTRRGGAAAARRGQAELAQGMIVRQTAPPVQPLQTTSAPVYRGANPGGDQEYDRPPVPHPAAPAYPPDYQQPNVAIAPPVPYQPQPQAGYQQPPPGYQPPIVYLGQPQFPGQQ